MGFRKKKSGCMGLKKSAPPRRSLNGFMLLGLFKKTWDRSHDQPPFSSPFVLMTRKFLFPTPPRPEGWFLLSGTLRGVSSLFANNLFTVCRDLKYEPIVSFEEGWQQTITWFAEHPDFWRDSADKTGKVSEAKKMS